ncbi:MAG: VanZ family protein [Lachnospiraceae bacterium]|nr:VanZ family protein [Lachnospiraceae bacterium]
MKQRGLKRIFLVCTIIWMAVIFSYSNKNDTASEKDSYAVGIKVGKVLVKDFEKQTEKEQLNYAKRIDFPVRKCAHATEYAILCLLVFGALGGGRNLQHRLMVSWCISVLYAVTDEIHQYFVPGRACRFLDVCIDGSGALVMVCLLLLYTLLRQRCSRGKIRRDAGTKQL